MPSTIPNCGTYLIEAYAVGTATANTFRLNTSTLNGTAVLGGEFWYDISQYIEAVSIFRGRQNVFRETSVAPGRASFKINDDNFYFSVVNTASPYWNATDNRLAIGVSTPIRISRDNEYLFVGQITTYDQNIMQPNHATVNVTCSDELQIMNNIKLAAQTTTQQPSGDRINAVLTSAAISIPRDIAVGVANIGAIPIEDGAGLRDYLLRIQNCEYGRMFVGRGGTFTAQARVLPQLRSVVAILSDTGTGIPYQTFDIENS